MISTTVKLHTCMPGHTIEALIKKENRHNVTKEELVELLKQFEVLNSSTVPRAGATVKIPILQRHEDSIKQ